MKLLSQVIPFVISTVNRYKIDESHGLRHSMEVLYHSHHNIQYSLQKIPKLDHQRNVIYTSALVHDLCDSKYIEPRKGVSLITNFLHKSTELNYTEINAITDIISTMSYSKVKVDGFPDLGGYQQAYHIVRESDLLAAYDPERSIIYNMYNVDKSFINCVKNADVLFQNRVLKHVDDGLFLTDYAKMVYRQYDNESRKRLIIWKQLGGMRDGIPIL